MLISLVPIVTHLYNVILSSCKLNEYQMTMSKMKSVAHSEEVISLLHQNKLVCALLNAGKPSKNSRLIPIYLPVDKFF